MLTSPLEQFGVGPLVYVPLLGYPLFTNVSFFLIVVCLLTGLLLFGHISSYRVVPSDSFQIISEEVWSFCGDLLRENAASGARTLFVYLPYVCSVFLFVLFCNFGGMVPFTYTPTSSLALTLAVAGATFGGINVVGILIHKIRFLGLFLPLGTPGVIAPFVVLVETISYLARVVSLAVRLFANMMAGHTLLKILAGFAWKIFLLGGAWSLFGLIPALVVFCVCFLELAVAFLQTYVFCVLVCLYLKDAAVLH